MEKTLHHDVKGRNGSGKVLLRSAPAGTGIIAGGQYEQFVTCLVFRILLLNQLVQQIHTM